MYNRKNSAAIVDSDSDDSDTWSDLEEDLKLLSKKPIQQSGGTSPESDSGSDTSSGSDDEVCIDLFYFPMRCILCNCIHTRLLKRIKQTYAIIMLFNE